LKLDDELVNQAITVTGMLIIMMMPLPASAAYLSSSTDLITIPLAGPPAIIQHASDRTVVSPSVSPPWYCETVGTKLGRLM